MKQDENESKEELSIEDNPTSDIAEVIKSLIPDELPSDKKEQINQLMLVSQSHSGPLPPPLHVEKYNQVIPNGAERLMQAVEKEGDHRRAMESKMITSRIWQMYIGLGFAFILALAVVGASVFLAVSGSVIPAAVLTGAFALAAVFITRKNTNTKPPEKT